jgi:hypothetical protein
VAETVGSPHLSASLFDRIIPDMFSRIPHVCMASLTSTQLTNLLRVRVCQMSALLLENGADVNARNIYGQVVNSDRGEPSVM